eukprot:scaffold34663_cov205-Amphora_coffeaeformis.AAC.6
MMRLHTMLHNNNSNNGNDDDSPNDAFNDEFDENPDLVGVHVDGYPLPPTPVRADDDELLAAIRRVPLTEPFDPMVPRSISVSKDNEGEGTDSSQSQPLRIIIAGGGLGGLALASECIQRGYDVHIFEQAKQYQPFGGPIQIQSNALWALSRINPAVYDAVAECGVTTGDRLSGIKDGVRCHNEGWLVKFDASTPALRCGLPLTLAINRVALQEIFLKYGVPRERIHIGQRVVGYQNLKAPQAGVCVQLDNGSTVYGDILIGADGIWSAVRHQMLGLPPSERGPRFATKHARYSGYTCYTGTCQHTPIDIDQVAYKVFLGQKQYFGCTDTGNGWQHWWAFLDDPPGQSDTWPALERLRDEFRDWSSEIHDLFDATKPEVVKRRDLFDRLPMFREGWQDGCAALLGDAAHVTLPNLGQGGAMAIEDAYVFGQEMDGIQHTDEIPQRLRAYEKRRFVRASIAQFLSRNGSDLLDDWERLRNTPLIGPIALYFINLVQPITMDYLYSAKF